MSALPCRVSLDLAHYYRTVVDPADRAEAAAEQFWADFDGLGDEWTGELEEGRLAEAVSAIEAIVTDQLTPADQLALVRSYLTKLRTEAGRRYVARAEDAARNNHPQGDHE